MTALREAVLAHPVSAAVTDGVVLCQCQACRGSAPLAADDQSTVSVVCA